MVSKSFLASGEAAAKERERLRALEARMQEMEDQLLCPICMERRRNVTFQCGHGACEPCTQGLHVCHMCRSAPFHFSLEKVDQALGLILFIIMTSMLTSPGKLLTRRYLCSKLQH